MIHMKYNLIWCIKEIILLYSKFHLLQIHIESIEKKMKTSPPTCATYFPGQIIGQNFDSINPKSKAQNIYKLEQYITVYLLKSFAKYTVMYSTQQKTEQCKFVTVFVLLKVL